MADRRAHRKLPRLFKPIVAHYRAGVQPGRRPTKVNPRCQNGSNKDSLHFEGYNERPHDKQVLQSLFRLVLPLVLLSSGRGNLECVLR